MIQSIASIKSFEKFSISEETYLKEIEEKIQKIANDYLKDSRISDSCYFDLTNPLIQHYIASFVYKFEKATETLSDNNLDRKKAECIFEELKIKYNKEIEGIALNLAGKLCWKCLLERL